MNINKLTKSAYRLLALCALFFITLIVCIIAISLSKWSFYLLIAPIILLGLIIKQSFNLVKIYKDDR